MQAFYPLKFKPSAPKASRPGSTSIFPCPWRRQSACKPAKKSSGNCWIALNYTWYENSYLSSKPLKGQAKPTKLLCRPPENRLPKTNGAAAPTQVAPDPPVRENLTHDFLSAYEILGLNDKNGLAFALAWAAAFSHAERNPAEVDCLASDLIELSTRHNFVYWLAIGAIWRGWARSASGNTVEGVPWIEQGIRDCRATGALLSLPQFLAQRPKHYI